MNSIKKQPNKCGLVFRFKLLYITILTVFVSSFVKGALIGQINQNEITYSDGTSTDAIIEQANPGGAPQINTLNIEGVTVENFTGGAGFVTENIKSAISLGGNNGSQFNGGLPQLYGSLTINADKLTNITGIYHNALAGIYARTDSQNALTQINSDATINLQTTHGYNSTGLSTSDRTFGILSENLGVSLGKPGGDAGIKLGANSNISVQGYNRLMGVAALGNSVQFTSAKGSKITVTGLANADPIDLFGVKLRALKNDISEAINDGDIFVDGRLSAGANSIVGIDAIVRAGNPATGKLDLINSGSITTLGNNAIGINLVNDTIFGETNVQLYSSSIVQGGLGINSAGISTSGISNGKLALDNYGIILSDNDQAIKSSSSSNQTVINNYGQIIGYTNFTATAGTKTFNNFAGGKLLLQDFSTGTKGIVTSDFGANATFINQGTIMFSVKNDDGTATTGILNNLNLFQNDATSSIKLASDYAYVASNFNGNTLTITNGLAGNYISNGGSLILNTVLDDATTGGGIGLSDRLIVDNAQTGSNATQIFIRPVAGSVAGLTVGDGIKVVEVHGTSSNDAFSLAAPVTYGMYEYILGQGSGTNAASWFLRSTKKGQALISPVAGAVASNLYQTGNMFMQNITDRRNAIVSPDSNVWMRSTYGHQDMDIYQGRQNLSINQNIFQLGTDFGRWHNVQLGAFAGVGHSKIDVQSNQTGTHADTQTEGYHLGVYGSWLPQNSGLYIDTWVQYAWFNNKLVGNTQQKEVNYDSSSWAVSAEIGHRIPVFETQQLNWFIEPHAQGIYLVSNTDDFTDSNYSHFSDMQADGFKTRLGGRLYGLGKNQVGISPFLEVNWLGDYTDNRIKINHQDGLNAEKNRNIAEAKLGFQGYFNKNLSAWAHLGGQWGSKNYTGCEAQIGLGYKWK